MHYFNLFNFSVFSVTNLDRFFRMRRNILNFCSVFEELFHARYISCLFITLTIREKITEVLAKNDFSRFLNTYLKSLKRKGLKIYGLVWVKELQERGVLHYHIVLFTNRLHLSYIPDWLKPDVKYWNVSTPHGTLEARKKWYYL